MVQRYLRPLGISPDEAVFADVYAIFMIKRAPAGWTGGRREQGDAIGVEYDLIAQAPGRGRAQVADDSKGRGASRQGALR